VQPVGASLSDYSAISTLTGPDEPLAIVSQKTLSAFISLDSTAKSINLYGKCPFGGIRLPQLNRQQIDTPSATGLLATGLDNASQPAFAFQRTFNGIRLLKYMQMHHTHPFRAALYERAATPTFPHR